MEIRDFVAETMKQIAEGAKMASTSEQEFKLDTFTSKGVHFNLAVTNTETSGKDAGGKAKVNLLKVVSFEGDKSNNSTVSSESVSRIEFNITYINPSRSGVTRTAPGPKFY